MQERNLLKKKINMQESHQLQSQKVNA